MTVQNPPDISTEPGTIELIGRVVPRPRWSWDGAREMVVRPPTPEPWSWAAVASGQEVAAAPPPEAPVAPWAAPAPAPRPVASPSPAAAATAWAPLAPPPASAVALAPARSPLAALRVEPLLAFCLIAAGWGLTFADARATLVLPVGAALLLLGAARDPRARPAPAVGTVLLVAATLCAAAGLVAVAWTLAWLGMAITLLGIGAGLFTRA